jgi:hypothetical protein
MDSVPVIEAVRATYFHWLVGSTVAVGAGVILEEAEDLIKYVLSRQSVVDRLPMVFIRDLSRFKKWSKRISRIGWVVLIAGCAGEGLFEILVSGQDSLLQAANSARLEAAADQIRQLGKVAAIALTDSNTAITKSGQAADKATLAEGASGRALTLARGAREEADTFEQDIASAKKQAADAEAHLAEALRQAIQAQRELNELRAWRTLSVAQQADVSEAAKPFAGTAFLLIVNPTSEAVTLTGQIASSLISAQWKWTKIDRFGIPGVNIDTGAEKGTATVWYRSGLTIAFRPQLLAENKDFPESAEALASVLGGMGIGVVGREMVSDDAVLSYIPPDTIVVIVGSKP